MYRDRKWNRKQSGKEKSLKKKNWYKRGGVRNFRTVLIVVSNPGGELIKRLTKREAKLNKNKDWSKKLLERGFKNRKLFYRKNTHSLKHYMQKQMLPLSTHDR